LFGCGFFTLLTDVVLDNEGIAGSRLDEVLLKKRECVSRWGGFAKGGLELDVTSCVG
jgi:predicted acyltransferase